MYRHIYRAPVRSEWSEFSLRSRPPKIRRFQAGPSNSSEDEESSVFRRKMERDLLRKRPSLRNENIMEDSIEYDVFTIAMSYPEGRQRMLDKLDEKVFSCHSNKKSSTYNQPSSNSSSEKEFCSKVKKSSEKCHKSHSSGQGHSEGHSKGRASRSLFRDETPLKNESKIYKDKQMEREDSQMDFRSKSQKETKTRSRSGSPPIGKKYGKRVFTAKETFEKRQPKFSLQDILGKHADESRFCEIENVDVDSEEQIDVGMENENLGQEQVEELEETGCSSQTPEVFFNNSFAENVDAWIEEFGCKGDGSLLAMLNSPVVDDNNNNYSSDTEVESDDARYYYENMIDSRGSDHSSEKIWKNGSLVWGRLSKTRWWPSIVIDGPMAGQKTARPGWTWLMWFGDHKISQMRLSQVLNFAHQFRQHCRGKLSSALEYAIIEALKVCADRADISLDGYNNIRRWGLLEMGFLDLVDAAGSDVDPFIPKTGSEFPAKILKELRKLRDQADQSDFDSDEEYSLQKEESLEKLATETGNFETGVLKDVDFCLSCAKHGRKIVGHHPVFEGYVCSKCKDALMESLLALDNDGCNLFCAVCGEGGELYVCEEKDCGRSFCVRCMKHYLSTDALKLVRGRSPWQCFLCTQYSLESHGVLVPRDGWQDELVKLYNPVFDQVIPSYDTASYTGRKLRVLSLFDGIGCVRLALEQLQLDVEVYYAAESDPNAQHVSLFNQGFAILHLGDVNSITKDKLQEICPIDLVVASPPSEDLDVTNREYEGFNGTGMLMFKFLMILKDIETLCKGNNSVYWLVESTAAMKSEYRKILSNFFQKEPCMWDAQFFSPYVLPKFYWGNIPALYSSFQYYKDNKEQFPTLEPYLATNVNRSSQVKKLRNCAIDMQVMSSGGSTVDGELVDPDGTEGEGPVQTPGPKRNTANSTMFSLPVQMDGKSTNIWIGEVERVLGLPVHYTDVSRLTIPQRQKLLKHASSVHLLKHLLAPLTEIFLTRI